MAYAAYLRVYEPVSAFREPDRSRWTAYADSPARPRRRDSLVAERAEAARRVITTPQVAVPEQESEHAYIRRADGLTYVCPWQTRLRCLLAYGRTRSADGDQAMAGTGPAPGTAAASGTAASGTAAAPGAVPARRHILGSIWTVPLTWFVPFAPVERWLSLGEGQGRTSAAATSLVELDYGGLVNLIGDDALYGDQSVAEIRAAIDGAARDEREFAVAMYMRARNRWRAFAEFEQAN